MKIALISHLHHAIAEPFLGGTEMHTAIVADELVRRGHDVTLFAQQGSRTLARLVEIVGTDFRFRGMFGPDGQDRSEAVLVEVVTRAIETIRTEGFDLVFNNSLGPLPYTMLAGHPMITVLHTPPTLEKVNAVITRPDWRPDPLHAYVSVSETNSEAWRALLPSTVCVPNGIYLDQWADDGRVEQELAVWTGRITPEKGLHLAIAAARLAGMRLEFSGPVADPSYYASAVAPELDEDIVYLGHADHRELGRLLGRGAVYVSSSLWAEPFGLASVEAMACGTPVAAVPNGAAFEIVGETGGCVARDKSVRGLAEAIKLARDCDRGLVRAGVQRFDAQLMMDRYEHVMAPLVRAASR
ncbi:MAG TPA: glycosyltransferase [Propionibacteriaceae bacterium]